MPIKNYSSYLKRKQSAYIRLYESYHPWIYIDLHTRKYQFAICACKYEFGIIDKRDNAYIVTYIVG